MKHKLCTFLWHQPTWMQRWHARTSAMCHRLPVVHALIVGTGVIAYWRGLWLLLDYVLFPGQPIVSSILSMLLGISLLFVDDFKLEELR